MTKLIKMDKEWKDGIAKSKWWATGYKGELSDKEKKVIPLRDILLKFGGEEVCLDVDEYHLDVLLNDSIVLKDFLYEEMLGAPSRCHQNSCYLWEAMRKQGVDTYDIMTGYALSEDSMWRQHSWLVAYNGEEEPYTVIETTEERVMYYGHIMTDEEALEFVSDCI